MAIDISTMPEFRPYTNIQPFTVRDGATYLLQLEAIKDWLRDYVIPAINAETGELAENWKEQTLALIAAFNAAVVEMNNTVNEAVEGVEENKDAAEAAQAAAEAAAALAEQFASDVVAFQDSAITSLFNNTLSQLRNALDGQYLSIEDASNEYTPLSTTALIQALLETGRLSEASLNGKYLAYLLWDGVRYPERVEGAVNVYIGPVDPGLSPGDSDVWARPDLVNIETVVNEVQQTSELRTAVISAAKSESIFVPVTAMDMDNGAGLNNTVLGTSPNIRLAKILPAGAVGRMFATVKIPSDWESVRITPHWQHSITSPTEGKVLFILYATASPYNEGSSRTLESTNVARDVVKTDFSAPLVLPENRVVSFTVARNGSNAGDTFPHPIQFLGFEIHKAS